MSAIKMICFGARDNEQPFFHQLNKYQYNLTLVKELLTEENVDLIKGHNAVMLRGNCNAKKNNLEKMKAMGVEYLLTRTVGTDHMDLEEAHKLGFTMARVPGYSPNAIAELAVTLAMMLLRHTADTTTATSKGDFTVHPSYFSREIRNLTVGVVGVGKIGLTAARLFKGLGATVIGSDVFHSEEAKQVVEFVSLDEIAKRSDIISLHVPYIKDKNHHFIDGKFLSAMRPDSILVNAARGELVDTAAVLQALKNGPLEGFAADVLEGEAALFNKNFDGKSSGNPLFDELVKLYPRVLITPHLGSNTDEACRNMIEQSYDNLNDFILQGDCKNKI